MAGFTIKPASALEGVGQSGYEFSFLSMSGCRIVGRRKFLSRL
jgi:hypothetical protein